MRKEVKEYSTRPQESKRASSSTPGWVSVCYIWQTTAGLLYLFLVFVVFLFMVVYAGVEDFPGAVEKPLVRLRLRCFWKSRTVLWPRAMAGWYSWRRGSSVALFGLAGRFWSGDLWRSPRYAVHETALTPLVRVWRKESNGCLL